VVDNAVTQIFWTFCRWERRQGYQKLNCRGVISRMQTDGIVHAVVKWWLTNKNILYNHEEISQQWVLSRNSLNRFA